MSRKFKKLQSIANLTSSSDQIRKIFSFEKFFEVFFERFWSFFSKFFKYEAASCQIADSIRVDFHINSVDSKVQTLMLL